MKTLLKKGTRQVNQKQQEECLKNWGKIAYGSSPNICAIQNNTINMNNIFAEQYKVSQGK